MHTDTSKYLDLETVTTVYPTKIIYTELKHRILANKKPKKDLDIEIPPHIQEKMDAENLERSIRHTKKQIKDIIECNGFTHFGTLTADNKKVDRRNPEAIKKAVIKWLSNQRRHSPDFKYLLVPERHKKCHDCAVNSVETCPHPEESKAFHFHVLFANYNGKMADSGRKWRGEPIYNLKSFKIGNTNITKIRSLAKTANYCRKYITKDLATQKNVKRYWVSKNIERPQKIYNLTPDEVIEKYPVDLSENKQRYEWENDHIQMTILPLKEENSHD